MGRESLPIFAMLRIIRTSCCVPTRTETEKKSPAPFLSNRFFTKYAGNQGGVQPVWAASKSAARFSNGISGVKTLAGLTR